MSWSIISYELGHLIASFFLPPSAVPLVRPLLRANRSCPLRPLHLSIAILDGHFSEGKCCSMGLSFFTCFEVFVNNIIILLLYCMLYRIWVKDFSRFLGLLPLWSLSFTLLRLCSGCSKTFSAWILGVVCCACTFFPLMHVSVLCWTL